MILVVDNAEPVDKQFNAPLVTNLSVFAKVTVVNYQHIPPSDTLEMYEGIVLSGTPTSYRFDTIDSRLHYLQWIKTITIPMLGICLGHQNLGRLFGAEVVRNTEAEQGTLPLEIVQDDPLFKDVQSGDLVVDHHRAAITLPDGFELLAKTARCHNQAMKHADRALYGVQFHAELSTDGSTILRNFVAIARAASKLN